MKGSNTAAISFSIFSSNTVTWKFINLKNSNTALSLKTFYQFKYDYFIFHPGSKKFNVLTDFIQNIFIGFLDEIKVK